MEVIKNLVHAIKMAVSSAYATNYKVTTALAQLQETIARCHHSKANMELIRSLVEDVGRSDFSRWVKAVELLVEANNFDCKAYAIELNPSNGRICGDQLMATARENLRHCGHGDHATWARKKLILARKWYRIAGALTEALASEINAGLDKAKWVLQMWPYYQDIIDPEGH